MNVNDAEIYRRLAETCMDRADAASTEELKERLVRQARYWLVKAAQAAKQGSDEAVQHQGSGEGVFGSSREFESIRKEREPD